MDEMSVEKESGREEIGTRVQGEDNVAWMSNELDRK